MQLTDKGQIAECCPACGTEHLTPAAAPTATVRAPSRSLPPGDLIAGIRARLAEVALEVARLEGLRVEQKQLTKMLAVADRVTTKRRAVNGVLPMASPSDYSVAITAKN